MAYTRVNWEDLPSTDTPISATNLNIMDEGIYNNSISNTYSTTETQIGTWIDGKPIYRKVLNIGTVTVSGTTREVAHNIFNLSRVIKLWGSAISADTNHWIQFPTPTGVKTYLEVEADATKLYFDLGLADFGLSNVYVVIEYTKTTD